METIYRYKPIGIIVGLLFPLRARRLGMMGL